MLGALTNEEIETLLKEQLTGRLACYADEEIYIVPVNYVYKDSVVYAHSGESKKIAMMRKNPKVCFEIDVIDNIFNWKSVVAWGIFEEITNLQEKQQVMQDIIHSIMPHSEHPDGHPSHGITEKDYDIGTSVELVIYKITLDKKTGRFERNVNPDAV